MVEGVVHLPCKPSELRGQCEAYKKQTISPVDVVRMRDFVCRGWIRESVSNDNIRQLYRPPPNLMRYLRQDIFQLVVGAVADRRRGDNPGQRRIGNSRTSPC